MKKVIAALLIGLSLWLFAKPVLAHPGRTAADGCHYCRTNCDSWGVPWNERHCHGGGSDTGPTPIYIAPTQPPTIIYPTLTPKPLPTKIPTKVPTPTELPTPTTKPQITAELLQALAAEKITSGSGVLLADLILEQTKAVKTQTATTIQKKEIPEVVVASETSPISSQEPQDGVKDSNESTENIYPVYSVVDGDTIRVLINGKPESVRLLSIDTPETKDPRKPVQCFGDAATQKMVELVSGKQVKLTSDTLQPNRDKYNRLLRYVYFEDGTFINAEMVRQGYAFAYTKYLTDKNDEMMTLEKEAREANRGLWSSCPVEQSGNGYQSQSVTSTETSQSTSQPEGCNIKGNINSSGDKIFHLPGCGSYERTKIDESNDEHWFCTEDEAVQAGWRKAKNC